MVERKKELCILHIGTEKTGSTTIQSNFSKSVSDKRVCYPDLGPFSNNIHLYSLFLQDPSKLYYFFKENNYQQEDILKFQADTKKQLEHYFLTSSKEIFILSSEALAVSTYEEVEEMQFFLKKFFKKVLVIVYVRPPQSFCNSAFQQRVKYHLLNTINYKLFFRYDTIKKYFQVYGEKNVIVAPFLPDAFYKKDIMKDFCKRVGIQEQASVIHSTNESLSKEAICILYTYNLHTNIHDKIYNIQLQHLLIDKLKSIGKEQFNFSGKLINDWAHTNFKKAYKWLLEIVPAENKASFKIDPSKEGVSSQSEILAYATQQIDLLVGLISDKAKIDFPLKNNPQTVAKLVRTLINEIKKDLNL